MFGSLELGGQLHPWKRWIKWWQDEIRLAMRVNIETDGWKTTKTFGFSVVCIPQQGGHKRSKAGDENYILKPTWCRIISVICFVYVYFNTMCCIMAFISDLFDLIIYFYKKRVMPKRINAGLFSVFIII